MCVAPNRNGEEGSHIVSNSHPAFQEFTLHALVSLADAVCSSQHVLTRVRRAEYCIQDLVPVDESS